MAQSIPSVLLEHTWVVSSQEKIYDFKSPFQLQAPVTTRYSKNLTEMT